MQGGGIGVREEGRGSREGGLRFLVVLLGYTVRVQKMAVWKRDLGPACSCLVTMHALIARCVGTRLAPGGGPSLAPCMSHVEAPVLNSLLPRPTTKSQLGRAIEVVDAANFTDATADQPVK